MTGSHTGRIALVTGGTTGIGFATAQALLVEGAIVVITGTHETRLTKAGVNLGTNCYTFCADNANVADSRKLADYCAKAFGRIDVLIGNAGICLGSRISEVTEAEYDREMDINLKGTLFLMPHSKAA